MKIKEMNEDSRPRERLVKFGVENLSDAELLALILEKGTKQENVIEMSNRLINKHGLNKLSDCSLKELQEIKGIGFAKACQILALFEINKRNVLSEKPRTFISSAKSVFDLMNEKLKDEKQEHFIAILLNNRNYFIKEQLLTKGVLDASIIDPREVFKPAIKNSASRIILVHNHPSGNPEPSKEDLEVTKKLFEAGELLGIKVLDHVIIGRDKYWSWKEH
ncbi:DNA repair protein RadC [Candidatus Pacearchaeota archaeon]|nr:DNA repair protein RadC [Candidatus Pacearchaeota archaeon]